MFYIGTNLTMPEFMKPAVHNRIMRKVHRGVMLIIQFQILTKKFQILPETRPDTGDYKFAARTRAYMIRKARYKGHQRPNVWSGGLEQRSRTPKITATRRKGRLTFRLGFRGDERAREMQAFSKADLKMLGEAAAKLYAVFAKQEAANKPVRRRRSPLRAAA